MDGHDHDHQASSSTPCKEGEGYHGPQDSPESSPFDLTKTKFSPHWSAWKPTPCHRSPSPLDLSSRGGSPTHWPSPIAQGTPGPSVAKEPPSPVRISAALQQAMDDSIASQHHLPSSSGGTDLFTASLPDALRNVGGGELEDTLAKALDNSPSSADEGDDDSLEAIVPKLDTRTMSDSRRRALIAKFKAAITELEGMTENHGGEEGEGGCEENEDDSVSLYTKRRLGLVGAAPTPPPRPAAIPRNRVVAGAGTGSHRFQDLDSPSWKSIPKLVFPPPPPDNSPERNRSPAADGLYGTDKVDHGYWHGFDQEYDVAGANTPFDSISFEEGLRSLQWRHSMGKWAEKGVCPTF